MEQRILLVIPGVRPGEHSAEFLNEIASRLTLFGALYLGIITHYLSCLSR